MTVEREPRFAGPLRIAQVAPLFESVPPERYGGTERVVSWLTEELVRLGHDVTLFASGDSRTKGRLVPICARALWRDPCADSVPHHLRQLEHVFRQCERFDVVHFHGDWLHFPLLRRHPVRALTTLHGRLDLAELRPAFEEYPEVGLVSISEAQRGPLPDARWLATVHHGLPRDLHTFRAESGSYLAFLGRVSPEKGVDRAIEIARRAGMPLRIAARIYPEEALYHERVVAPSIAAAGDLVEFVGEVGGADKDAFLGGARALLFPIDWPEPFGLVMIEALACGTPVIAFRRGSVPEVVEDGVTGFVVDDVDGAVAAVHRVGELSREACRLATERRFSVERMTRDYLALYERLVRARTAPEAC